LSAVHPETLVSNEAKRPRIDQNASSSSASSSSSSSSSSALASHVMEKMVVGHSVDALKPGESIVLTLKDAEVMDSSVDDSIVLQNDEIAKDERRKWQQNTVKLKHKAEKYDDGNLEYREPAFRLADVNRVSSTQDSKLLQKGPMDGKGGKYFALNKGESMVDARGDFYTAAEEKVLFKRKRKPNAANASLAMPPLLKPLLDEEEDGSADVNMKNAQEQHFVRRGEKRASGRQTLHAGSALEAAEREAMNSYWSLVERADAESRELLCGSSSFQSSSSSSSSLAVAHPSTMEEYIVAQLEQDKEKDSSVMNDDTSANEITMDSREGGVVVHAADTLLPESLGRDNDEPSVAVEIMMGDSQNAQSTVTKEGELMPFDDDVVPTAARGDSRGVSSILSFLKTTHEFTVENSKKESDDISYTDESGRPLTAKEAFQRQSRSFHGQKMSEAKKEKLMRQVEREMEEKRGSLTQARLTPGDALIAAAQQRTGLPYVDLSASITASTFGADDHGEGLFTKGLSNAHRADKKDKGKDKKKKKQEHDGQ
jgi:hypothetical protein